MDLEGKIKLVTRPPTDEVVTMEGLRSILEEDPHPKHYIGLEISGLLHLGSLVINGFKIRDFMKAGMRCRVFLADWHSYINNKFGGDWGKIRQAAKYYKEAFELFCPGVEVVCGSDLYHNNNEYWEDLVKFCKCITLARNTRCLTIMGRGEKEGLDFSQYLYPPMQAVDIRAMGLDIVHAGMDQRKAHMLVRDVFPKLGWKMPVAVHHSLLPGLGRPTKLGVDEDSELDLLISSKMSKSKPSTCIFVHDEEEAIRRKLERAWCPEGGAEHNPVLEYAKQIVFHELDHLEVDRAARYGGPITFQRYGDLEGAYREGVLHPMDLKRAVASAINRIILPVREYFKHRADLLAVFESELP